MSLITLKSCHNEVSKNVRAAPLKRLLIIIHLGRWMIKHQTTIGLLFNCCWYSCLGKKNGDTPPHLKHDVARDSKTSKIQIFRRILYIKGRTAALSNQIYKTKVWI